MLEFKWADYWITVIEDSVDDFRFSAIDIDGIDCAAELSDRENHAIFEKYIRIAKGGE